MAEVGVRLDVFQQLLAVIEGLPDDILIEPAYHIVQLGDQRFSASDGIEVWSLS